MFLHEKVFYIGGFILVCIFGYTMYAQNVFWSVFFLSIYFLNVIWFLFFDQRIRDKKVLEKQKNEIKN